MTIFRRTIATMLTGILATGPLFAAARPAKPAIQPKDAIRHVVVIFQENVSFDHYFATYPNAANLAGEPQFTALPNTPAVERPLRRAADRQPQRRQSRQRRTAPPTLPPRPRSGRHRRPGPRLPRRADGLRRRQDGPLPQVRRRRRRPPGPRHQDRHPLHHRPHHGLLRRQHRHRATGTTPSTSP